MSNYPQVENYLNVTHFIFLLYDAGIHVFLFFLHVTVISILEFFETAATRLLFKQHSVYTIEIIHDCQMAQIIVAIANVIYIQNGPQYNFSFLMLCDCPSVSSIRC